MFLKYLLLVAVTVNVTVAQSEPKSVIAHFIVGNAAAMTLEQWKSEINEAKKAHIDGFALNIATQDTFTDAVLQRAYDAAEAVGNFSMFLSFDYLSGGPWPVPRVIMTVNKYKNKSAQFYYKGKPLVSTFEGVHNVFDWPIIKAATGCSVIPTWTSLGPKGVAAVLEIIDGAFSWDAWPVGAQDKNTDGDKAWMHALGNKPYMMPVAPWFYTNLPQWGKNWLWRGDDLWHERWQQVIELQPPLVQIISWNDYGESHYIGPIYKEGIPDGAAKYVLNQTHDAWRSLLPYYIDAYKSGNMTTAIDPSDIANLPGSNSRLATAPTLEDKITYWYRVNPSTAGNTGGTTGNNPTMGQPALDPGLVSQDKIFVTVLVQEPSDVAVQIGEAEPTFLRANTTGISHFSVPFGNQTGPVTISILRDCQEIVTITGPEITDKCADGEINWNAFVGSSDRPKDTDCDT
ncbi:hypothetical protein VTN00DRAFT_6253 [Thermoascus crustaceus]|uniref:uncharacterized protein n=1 Tax=Thermoascus crustaceus TaxID=5088 RepID=UPI0037440C54